MTHLGTFPTPHSYVDVYFDDNLDGGSFTLDGRNKRPEIAIGPGSRSYDCLGYFLHEVMEMLMCLSGERYKSDARTGGSDDQLFVFDHVGFTRMVCCAAILLDQVLPKLQKARSKCRKSR